MSDIWPVLPLMPEPPASTMTVAAWLALDKDESGELVRGRLVEEEVPDATHEAVVAWLSVATLSGGVVGLGGALRLNPMSGAREIRTQILRCSASPAHFPRQGAQPLLKPRAPPAS